ncbi:MAG: response regulator [Chitinivibrionales bacterium]|nr:response regulator [Chitinivibrionales bacterium]
MKTATQQASRILVADDEEKIRFCINLALKMKGYDVECVADGITALKKIIESEESDRPYDLFICDIQMPSMNGEELIAKLQTAGIEIPILAISGYGDKDLVIRLMRNGCHDFMDKPFEPEEIETRVEKLLSELRFKSAALKKKNRLARLGKNFRSVAHDLNNLLGGALGYADMALEHCNDAGRSDDYIRKMLKSTTIAAQVCKSLLAIDKTGSSTESFMVRTEAGAIVERATAAIAGIAPSNITVSAETLNHPVWIKGDSLLLQRAILNLALNALDAMPGGGALHIKLQHAPVPPKQSDNDFGYVQIVVGDTGTGISKDIGDIIFEDRFTTKKDGNGMGLPIVKNIIEKHGGWIERSSNGENGAVFILSIPLDNRRCAVDETSENNHVLQPPVKGGADV